MELYELIHAFYYDQNPENRAKTFKNIMRDWGKSTVPDASEASENRAKTCKIFPAVITILENLLQKGIGPGLVV